MLTAEQIGVLRDSAEKLLDPITEYLLDDIAKRVAAAGQFTGTASYQVWRLQELGLSQRQIKKEIAKRLKISLKDTEKLLTQVAKTGYNFDMSRFPTKHGIPFSANSSLQQILQATVQLAKEDLTNITQTIGFVGPDGKCRKLTDAYNQACDFAFQKASTGAQDYWSAIREATKNLADQGIRVIDYESGVHTSLEAAVRRNIMGGAGLMQEKISQLNHDELGCDGWEISAHAASAPDHEPYQGKQYTDAEYYSLNNSLVRRIGTLNCGHSASPIIMGVNDPQYTAEELEQFRKENEEGITIGGKHYTLYEATQRQRKYERKIRKQRHKILVAGGLNDKEQLQTAQIKMVRLQEEYVRFSKDAKLPLQHARMEVAGFNWKHATAAESMAKTSVDPVAQKETLANPQSSGILNSREMYSKLDGARKGFKFITDEKFDALTVEARKQGAIIIRGTPDVERHLDQQEASASTVGDVLLFRRDVCISEVLEEMHHFKQNKMGLNDGIKEPMRTILNEIDAKEYLLSVSQKYKIPRNELEHIQKQLEGYRAQLKDSKDGG